VQAAIIAALKAHGPLVAIVGTRVYDYVPDTVDGIAYVRVAVPVWVPYQATGVVGGDITQAVHGFTRDYDSAEAIAIQKAIHGALADQDLILSDGYVLEFNPLGSQILDDDSGDQGSYHILSSYQVITGEEPA
jgi:hypothetical protein